MFTYLLIYLSIYVFMILSGSVRNTRTHFLLPTFSWWVGPLSSICRLKWGDTRTQNHTEGRHGAVFRCTKAVPWVQPGSVESGSDFWCRCALQGREQPGGAGVKAADWCFLIPSLAEKHTGFLLRAAGEFITSPLSSVFILKTAGSEAVMFVCVYRSFIAEMQLFVRQLGRSKRLFFWMCFVSVMK